MNDSHWSRGLIRTSLTAGVVMSVIATGALTIGLATGVVPSSVVGVRELVAVATRGFAVGALAGGLFGALVARGTRARGLSSLSTGRVALWGGLATGGVFLLTVLAAPRMLPLGVLASAVAIGAVGGSIVSAGMLKLARHGTPPLEASGGRG